MESKKREGARSRGQQSCRESAAARRRLSRAKRGGNAVNPEWLLARAGEDQQQGSSLGERHDRDKMGGFSKE